MAGRAALAVAICFAAGCGGSSSTMTSQKPPEPARLGCHQYCQQTGGFGAPPGGPPPMAVVARRAPVAVTSGLVPVTVECRFDRNCTGALLLTLGETELGRSDLAVPARAAG